MIVEVAGVLVKHGGGAAFVVEEEPVDAFLAERADDPLGVAVRLRCPRWSPHNLDAFGGERVVERLGVFRVPVADQVPERVEPPVQVHDQLACQADHPRSQLTAQITGEPGARKRASPVRWEAVGKRSAQQTPCPTAHPAGSAITQGGNRNRQTPTPRPANPPHFEPPCEHTGASHGSLRWPAATIPARGSSGGRRSIHAMIVRGGAARAVPPWRRRSEWGYR